MFKCQVTGKLVTKGPGYKIITKVRAKSYTYLRDNGGIREVTENELENFHKRLPFRERENFEEKRVIRSTGFEPEEVLTVCADVHDKHVANDGLTC